MLGSRGLTFPSFSLQGLCRFPSPTTGRVPRFAGFHVLRLVGECQEYNSLGDLAEQNQQKRKE